MTTTTRVPAAPRQRHPPPGRRRAVLGVGLVALLVATTVLVRLGGTTPTTDDLERITDALRAGCDPSVASTLEEGTGFALDGDVVEVQAGAARGRVVDVVVREWFRGPPLDRVRVDLDRRTLASLRDGGVEVGPGTRLLLSGPGFEDDGGLVASAGCGRTRPHDPGAVAAWREAFATADAPAPAGPAATYAAHGFRHLDRGGAPDVSGVLVHDDGCLYVQDGLTRWLPLFPHEGTGWTDDPARLVVAGQGLDVGHPVRLTGLPAGGVAPRGADPHHPRDVRARHVDGTGVPPGCDATSPRLVVAEPPAGGTGRVEPLPVDDPVVVRVTAAVRDAGLAPVSVTGEVLHDAYGSLAWRVEVTTRAGGALLVHVETVGYLAWPHAYGPPGARVRWSADPAHAATLPTAPDGSELAVVERADGTTQVLVRTPGRMVVSVEADPREVGLDATLDGGVAGLTAVASGVVLSPGDAGS